MRANLASPALRETNREDTEKARVLAREVEQLRDEMRQRHVESGAAFKRVHPSHRQSAANLVDYLTLRSYDLRVLQRSLAELGLSSLGRSEEHVVTTLERVLDTLHLLAGEAKGRRTEAAVGFGQGRTSLDANAEALIGPSPVSRPTRIMVTMPSEASEDYELVRQLMRSGMDCARINCAHDDPGRWGRMVENLRRSSAETRRPCSILMDLPGPKLRTGALEPGPRVLRLRPRRDALGRSIVPARAMLVSEGEGSVSSPAPTTDVVTEPRVPVPHNWLAELRTGDALCLTDTRGSRRTLNVTDVEERCASVVSWDTTYLATGTRIEAPGRRSSRVGLLPVSEQAILLHVGDILVLTASSSPASADGLKIACRPPEVLDALGAGERVFFDDGTIAGEVVRLRPGEADVRITRARPTGSKLRAEKGINFPDTHLRLPALVPEDDEMLRFVASHADIVGLSFVQSSEDVAALQQRLDDLKGEHLGIVLKVETTNGFAHLPDILLTAMASERIGVMVARGDLAVECGFERLAEVQEEILCLCDAAHVPVIWATQVLDQMARTGQPSRAEISDAAMASRAECVMLNKGPHIVQALAALDDILRRMSSHQRKKVALLRRLRSWSS
jgi:pyruvate kinase